MFLLDNQIYIDLEPHVDIDTLVRIEKDIIYGIVKSKHLIHDGGANFNNFYDQTMPSLLDEAAPNKVQDPSNIDYEYYSKLNFVPADCRMFARYALKTRQMGQILSLRTHVPTPGQNLKPYKAHNFDTPAYEHFPSLKKWIEELTIFNEVGRIMMWFNAPGEPHAIHKDQQDLRVAPDQFILINLGLDRKELFILDEDGKEYTVNSRVFMFDGRNYHGTRGKDWYGWTIRVDGVFNKEWLESMNIKPYFLVTT